MNEPAHTSEEIDQYRGHPPLDEIAFAHPSERIAAQILDYYDIRWEYEPRRFPIEWDGSGNVIAYFTPDFYLVDFDLYIELTTMNQKLVTRKNRKVKRLKELYPEINIKIFYQKDFKALLARFGVTTQHVPRASGGGVSVDEAAHGDSDGTKPGSPPSGPESAEGS